VDSKTNSTNHITNEQPTTLRRIYDINNRVYKHLYHSTFTQLNKLHFDFENTINKLYSVKRLSDLMYMNAKNKIADLMVMFSNRDSLAAKCAQYIGNNNLSIEVRVYIF
jgi:hypothetical protein